MEKHYIVYDGKDYEITEPTIEFWNRLMLLKDLYEEKDFSLMIISLATGLDIEEVKNARWDGVYETSNYLADYFLNVSDKFYHNFEFRGIKYQFIDLENLTFGEFIDLEEFFNRPTTKKQTELNYLMALLYREVDSEGNLTPYDATKVMERATIFKSLPIRYLRGAQRFFFHLSNILRENTRSYFHLKMNQMKWKINKLLRGFGDGMEHLYFYLVKIYSRFKMWREKTYLKSSIS
jgi:hypothetical protein